MTFGITNDGFTAKRQPDIQAEMEQDFRDTFGDVDTSPESVIGQIIGIFSKPHTDVWEQMENVYLNDSPTNAEGLNLDYILAINGLERLPSLPTTVEVGLAGSAGTTVPQGTLLSTTTTGDQFTQKTGITITDQNQIKLFVRVDVAVDGNTYTIDIDGSVYSIIAAPASTVDSIAIQLRNEINGDPSAVVSASVIGDVVALAAKTSSFDTTLTGDLTYFTVAYYESVDKGEILAIVDTITIIDTPVTGLDEVNNFEEGEKGRGAEEDSEARLRREQSLQILGAGTLPAMVARVQRDVDGVVTVKGFENREDVVVDSRPPHSFELVVVGGIDQDIADLIWLIKPGGIETYGNVNGFAGVDVIDGNGDVQTMHFSRAVDKYAWIRATLTLYDEEQFPPDGEDQVKQAILDYGNTFTIGLDLIPQRFIGPIMEIPGIGTILVEVDLTNLPTDTPSYGTSIIPVDETELAQFALSRITVNITP